MAGEETNSSIVHYWYCLTIQSRSQFVYKIRAVVVTKALKFKNEHVNAPYL